MDRFYARGYPRPTDASGQAHDPACTEIGPSIGLGPIDGRRPRNPLLPGRGVGLPRGSLSAARSRDTPRRTAGPLFPRSWTRPALLPRRRCAPCPPAEGRRRPVGDRARDGPGCGRVSALAEPYRRQRVLDLVAVLGRSDDPVRRDRRDRALESGYGRIDLRRHGSHDPPAVLAMVLPGRDARLLRVARLGGRV